MKLCAECAEKHKELRPVKYALGKCDKCGTYIGVAEMEYIPQSVDDLFGNLNKKSE